MDWINNCNELDLQDGPSYIRVFVSILRDIFKEETVEYVLALIDEMLTGKEGNNRAFTYNFAFQLA